MNPSSNHGELADLGLTSTGTGGGHPIDVQPRRNRLARSPRWYNVFDHNCTTTIRFHVRQIGMARALGLPAALDRLLEELRFANLQPGLELLDSVETRYGHVAVARLGEQVSIVGDGQVRVSFPLPREVEREAAYFYAQAAGAERATSRQAAKAPRPQRGKVSSSTRL